MIHLTDADKEKIKLLDEIFRTIPVDVIRKWSEADKIFEVLKIGATPKPNGVIIQAFDDNNRMNTQIIQLQADINSLRISLQTVARIMTRPQFDFQNTNDINTLKAQLGIY